MYCQQMFLDLLAGVLKGKKKTFLSLRTEKLIIVSSVVAGYEGKAK